MVVSTIPIVFMIHDQQFPSEEYQTLAFILVRPIRFVAFQECILQVGNSVK